MPIPDFIECLRYIWGEKLGYGIDDDEWYEVFKAKKDKITPQRVTPLLFSYGFTRKVLNYILNTLKSFPIITSGM
jgi:hypothetical protein